MKDFFQPLLAAGRAIRQQPLAHLLPVSPLLGTIVLFLFFSNDQNRQFDIELTYWVLWLTLVAGVIGLLLSLPVMLAGVRWIRAGFSHRVWITPFVIALAASVFVAQYVEPRHRIQSDEAGLLSNARSMEHNAKAASCDEGYFSADGLDCVKLVQNFKTKSVPFLFSLIQDIEFPHSLSNSVVFGSTLVLLLPTAMLMFAALLIYGGSPWVATLATVFVLSHPTVLFQFNSASVEPWYLFFAAFAAFAFACLRLCLKAPQATPIREPVFPLAPLALIAALIAFAAQTRQESLASFGFILAPLWLYATLRPRDKAFFFSCLAVFILPVLWLVYAYRGYSFQAGDNQAHGLGNLIEHLGIAWQVMTTSPSGGELVVPFIPVHMWLAAVGLLYTLVQVARKDELSIRLLWFVVLALPQTLVIFENVSGDMTIQINQRYSLVFIPLIAVMAAQSTRLVQDLVSVAVVRQLAPARLQAVSMVLLSVALAGWTATFRGSFEKNIMYNRNYLSMEEHALRGWFQGLDPDTPRLYIYSRPWHFVAYGQSSIHYSTWQRMPPSRKQQIRERFGDQIFYARGMDCWNARNWHPKAVEDRITHICDLFERSNSLVPVHSERIIASYDLEVHKLDFSASPFGARLRVDDLSIDTGEDEIRVTGRVVDCAGQTGLRWLVAGQRRDWECAPGALDLAFPSVPGLRRLELLEADGRPLLSRLILHPADTVRLLTELQPVTAQVGWGELQIGRSNGGNPLTVARTRYADGIGAHAYSRIGYELDGRYAALQTGYGLDDEEIGGDGAIFKVFGDGRLLWASKRITHGEIHLAEVDITGVRQLELVTEPGADNLFDHTDWILPVLVGSGS